MAGCDPVRQMRDPRKRPAAGADGTREPAGLGEVRNACPAGRPGHRHPQPSLAKQQGRGGRRAPSMDGHRRRERPASAGSLSLPLPGVWPRRRAGTRPAGAGPAPLRLRGDKNLEVNQAGRITATPRALLRQTLELLTFPCEIEAVGAVFVH